MLDIIYLGRIFPHMASIMAKKELQWMPFLGQYLTASGAVFVNRSSNKDAISALAAAGEKMRSRGMSLWMFPEGTRNSSKETTMLPFKKGAFHTAVQAGVPIIPVVCQNYWHLYHKGVLEPGKLKIVVLEPVPTTGLTSADVPELITRVRDAMLAALVAIDGAGSPVTTGASETTPLLPTPPKVVAASGDVEGSDEDGVLVDRP